MKKVNVFCAIARVFCYMMVGLTIAAIDNHALDLQKIPVQYFSQTIFHEVVASIMQGDVTEERLTALSKQVNALVPYRADDIGWGVEDKWTTPRETSQAGYGDCEDIAFVKFSALRTRGDMTVKMGYGIDVENFPTKVAHMVALIYFPGEVVPYVLNNYGPAYLRLDAQNDFILLFVFDEGGFIETGYVKEFKPFLISYYRAHVLFHRKLFFEKLNDELSALRPT
jgi:predicted transglutaminase-like cysteine proteinase